MFKDLDNLNAPQELLPDVYYLFQQVCVGRYVSWPSVTRIRKASTAVKHRVSSVYVPHGDTRAEVTTNPMKLPIRNNLGSGECLDTDRFSQAIICMILQYKWWLMTLFLFSYEETRWMKPSVLKMSHYDSWRVSE